jgi:Icc-related predicted phosphoesterase
VSGTPAIGTPRPALRVAAVGDLHCTRGSHGQLQPLFAQASDEADVLVLCGDLTDYGLPEEARVLARELSAGSKIPVVAVLGNHDYESGQPEEVRRILTDVGVTVLDGDGVEVRGLGIAGAKGFGGGFGRRTLQPWGEAAVKAYVKEAVDEALKLESGLAKLRTERRIAVLHYAPVQGTVEGEPPEIYSFLGSTRLEEPLNRYEVCAVFHGHAHHGSAEGRTSSGVPVYNVSLPLLRRLNAERPLKLLEIPTGAGDERRRAPIPEPAPTDTLRG